MPTYIALRCSISFPETALHLHHQVVLSMYNVVSIFKPSLSVYYLETALETADAAVSIPFARVCEAAGKIS
jgi:hypothetical protein